jgi:hypothetical protein
MRAECCRMDRRCFESVHDSQGSRSWMPTLEARGITPACSRRRLVGSWAAAAEAER